MKYESEILYDLMKRDGLLNPSQDNLPYESELKEKYVNDVVGAYPKLQDYRPEWLNYNKCEYIPADFPTESQTNQTSGVFKNVVPFAYDVATLKGQTLLNVIDKPYILDEFTQDRSKEFTLKSSIKSNTDYLIIYDIVTESKAIYTGFLTNSTTWSNSIDTSKTKGFLKLNSGDNPNYFRFIVTNGNTLTVNSIMIIKYQKGMENWDIPYFEGMQSVKMPVLKTSNEDGTKSNILTVNENVTLRRIGNVKDTLDCLTGEVIERIGEIVLDGSENWIFHGGKTNTNIYRLPYSKLAPIENFILCDKLPVAVLGDVEKISTGGAADTDYYAFYIALSITKANTLSNFKSYLSENPLVVQYQLKTPTIKTVDLSCINEDNVECDFIPIMDTMHYQTSSNTIPPLVDLTVCVEATTQNLASFVDLEGVEHNE